MGNPTEKVSPWLWAGFGVGLVMTLGGAFPLGLLVGIFFKPHAFGGRDGQGAAAVAAAMLLASAVATGIGLVVLAVTALRLRSSGKTWPARVALISPAVALILGVALSLL